MPRRLRRRNPAEDDVGSIVNRPDIEVPDFMDFEGSEAEYQQAVNRAWREQMKMFAQQAQDIGKPELAQQALAQIGAAPPTGASPFAPGGAGPARRLVDEELLEEMLRPSDRPEEPITTGLPFGAGANFTRLPDETDEAFRGRVASELLESPTVTGAVKDFVNKRLLR